MAVEGLGRRNKWTANHAERFKLLHGPYHPPRAHPGEKLICRIRGAVKVGGYTDARIPWPCLSKKGRRGGGRSLIVCGGLVEAVKNESEVAVAYWFGVCIQTVRKWRRALGVPPHSAGTRALQARFANARDDGHLERIQFKGEAPRSAAGRASLSASQKGRPRPRPDAWTPAEDAKLHGFQSDETIARELG